MQECREEVREEMRFAMTDDEIVQNYKNAKKPKDQVKILAELNGVTTPEMARKLKELGLDVDVRWFTSGGNFRKKDKEDTENMSATEELQKVKQEAEELREELAQQREVVRAMGETLEAVRAKAGQSDKYRKVIMILMEE